MGATCGTSIWMSKSQSPVVLLFAQPLQVPPYAFLAMRRPRLAPSSPRIVLAIRRPRLCPPGEYLERGPELPRRTEGCRLAGQEGRRPPHTIIGALHAHFDPPQRQIPHIRRRRQVPNGEYLASGADHPVPVFSHSYNIQHYCSVARVVLLQYTRLCVSTVYSEHSH